MMRKSGVDAFIVGNCHPAYSAKKNNTCSEELRDTHNILQKNDGQGLLPKTFICEFRYNNECDLDERRCLPIRYRCHYLCLNYKQCISEQDHNNFSCESLITLVKLVDKRLTKNQKRVLKKIETTQKTTMTSLSNLLSEELSISKTTVRNTLQTLRDVGLINCGDAENKGRLVGLTKIGEIVIEELKDINKENKEMKK